VAIRVLLLPAVCVVPVVKVFIVPLRSPKNVVAVTLLEKVAAPVDARVKLQYHYRYHKCSY
jgi:hypothetical protein